MTLFLENLWAIAKDVRINEPMSAHTSFCVGGRADYFVMPKSSEEICSIISLCQRENVPFFIMGNGSNLLVGDKGIRGVVIKIGKNMSAISKEGNLIIAQSGALLSSLSAFAREEALKGLAFAGGIPGSVGGAVCMNAGAYGGEMAQVVLKTEYVTPEGEIRILEGDEHSFSYRHSFFTSHSGIITRVWFSLSPGNKEEIKAEMKDYALRRRSKQPLEFPSAGSFFKRPCGNFAGALIEQAGLKGFSIGGACVSEKHAGFIINTGNASASDIVCLMHYIQDKVNKTFGVILEPEVLLVGEF